MRRWKLFVSVLGAAAGLSVLSAALPLNVSAEEVRNAFGTMSKDSGKPIDIESDTLTVYDEKKLAVFRGRVKAVQGATMLRAAQLDVHYVGGANKLTGRPDPKQEAAQTNTEDGAGQGAGGQPQIEKIVARGDVIVNGEENQTTKSDELVYDVAAQKVTVTGNVVINSDEDQTTTSDWAIYDVAGRKAVVGGNVILSQGENVLKGDRLHINHATGESRFENTGTTPDGSRRIRALLLPKDEDGIPGRGKKKKDAAQSP